MSLKLYMDVHVPRPITNGLRLRSVDVVMAQEDGAARLPDPELLDRASSLERVLFSQDPDLLAECAHRQEDGLFFAGLVYVHPLKLSIGQIVADLELIAKVYEPSDTNNRVEYLPLR